jgi:iron complex outermembrane receptor protein
MTAQAVELLPEYVVRAWHFDAENLGIPADVTRIGRVEIDRSLANSLPDLLATEANLFFSTVPGSTKVSMRGFGEGSGPCTLILIDGQPLNPPDMGRINWEQIPLDSIESIEVLRGGHNVLYGDKALSGVIKIETRRTDEKRLDIKGRLGSFGSSQASVSGGFGGDAWNISGGVFGQLSDGYRDNSASETRNAYMTAGRTLNGSDDLDIRIAFGKSDLTYPSDLIYEAYKSNPRASSNLGDQGSENQYATATVRWEGQRDWGSWEVLSGYDHNEIVWTFGAGSYGENVQDGFSFKPRARLELGERLAFIFGNDLLYDRLDFTQYPDEAHTLVSTEAALSERRISPFAFAEYDCTDRLTVSCGARYEWVRFEVDSVSYDQSQFQPIIETNRGPRTNYENSPDKSFAELIHQEGMAAEISLNYRQYENLSFWLGYDRVYRYPVCDERASYQGYDLAENINQDLDAMEGDNYELGLKYASGSQEFYATAFLLLMKNEIIYDPVVLNAALVPQGLNINLGPVRRTGDDLSYRYTAADWGFSVRIAYLQTEQQSGAGSGYEVPLVPDFHTASQIWWEPLTGLRLRWIHRYVGERFAGGDFTNDEQKIDDYHLFDAHVEVDASANCRLFLKVDNVFDCLYAESAYSGLYYPGDGRSISLGMKLNF